MGKRYQQKPKGTRLKWRKNVPVTTEFTQCYIPGPRGHRGKGGRDAGYRIWEVA